MLFNTLEFALFFLIVYGLYLSFNHKAQNRMLLVASYIFYGMWNWKFLFLILASTLLDYVCGMGIHKSPTHRQKKQFLVVSVIGNLTILGFFKYHNFFIDNIVLLFNQFNLPLNPQTLNILLPVGISFYTFQSMGYTLDIYNQKITPTKNVWDYSLYVSFFPQLVAGPIERAGHLLPQIANKRQITQQMFGEGMYLIFFGLFQKVFIADNLGWYVNTVYSSPPPYSGLTVLLASYAFAFQIYCDFAGYSNIARGLGRLMGFDISLNFNLPYFSTNPQEFWRRWHITLSNWLRDYLYIPLGGNKKGRWVTYRNIGITMLLGGLWHGANWNFLVWGIFHAFLLISYHLLKPLLLNLPIPKSQLGSKLWFLVRVLFFFHLVCIGWIFFRAETVGQAVLMMKALITNPSPIPGWGNDFLYILFFTVPLLTYQVMKSIKKDLFLFMSWSGIRKTVFVLIAVYLCLYVLFLGQNATIGGGSEFIYFQF